ncbi:hypothetical protein [Roseomonas sp. BN140053]|uniref:hypothetical protein n=1 Tax=Roseomonas sp. BN140053 TaxID=3391898 RepID=UPI0039E95EC4
MTTQATGRLAPTSHPAPTAGGKAVAKTADFKGALARAQAPFPPARPQAARINAQSLALLAQAEANSQARDAAAAARSLARTAAGPDRTAAPAGVQVVALRTPAPRAFAAAPGAGEAELRARIALLESGQEPGMGYGARNASSGALGRYQFMPVALRDIGWQDAQGRWTDTAARQGVTSDAGFLGNAAAQEAAMDTYLQRKASQLTANGSMATVGQVLPGLDGQPVPLTEAGLVAAAHRRGAATVARWLEHRARTPDAPLSPAQRNAFNNVEQRLRDFAGVPYGATRSAGVAGMGAGSPAI